ncbi:MAG: gluconate 2-dehydrogenase subunit 3 family protein [Verrucomicrobia bacterium]|nr:gluconate 2-dehydrogenase subunit 3 family protein [Verrucomicrobiota bacterium]
MNLERNRKPSHQATMSRRDALKRVALAGAGVAMPNAWSGSAAAAGEGKTGPLTPIGRREALETLNAKECDILEAIVARLIPTDDNGPGAAEARAAHYIDRALAGPLSSSRKAYAAGLAAIDAYALAKRGRGFVSLAGADQDDVLTDIEKNVPTDVWPNASEFFELVRLHTIQGMFCDPYYGGNANFIGWNLIAYPGIRLAVNADDQRMQARPEPLRQSAYDLAMFAKRGGEHGH